MSQSSNGLAGAVAHPMRPDQGKPTTVPPAAPELTATPTAMPRRTKCGRCSMQSPGWKPRRTRRVTSMPDATHYTYRVAWSVEDGEHVATVAEFPSLSWLAPTPAVGAAEIWSGRPGVFGYPGALGRYLAGTGRQFGADLNGEVQVRLTAGHLLQAFGDERSGLGNVTAALGEPRAQEDEFRSGERRAGDEPVQQFVLGGSREPVEEHLVPCGEVVRPFLAPVTGLIEGSVHGARPLGIRASGRLQRLQVGLGELPPHIWRRKQPGKRNGQERLLSRHLTVAPAGPAVVCLPADELLRRTASERRESAVPEQLIRWEADEGWARRGYGLRYHELRCLHRIVGVEVVVSLHVAGQVDDLRDGLLCWSGVAGRQGRQRVGYQPAERVPPLRPFGVVHSAVPRHVGAVLGQLDEGRHFVQDPDRVW